MKYLSTTHTKHLTARIIITLPLLLLYTACTETPTEPIPTSFPVRLEITGTARTVSITYKPNNTSTAQIASVELPWEHSYTGIRGQTYYLSAQNNGSSGEVTVTVYRNGHVYKTVTSTGGYVIATASGSL